MPMQLPPLPDETHYDDPDCPSCQDTLGGTIDGSGQCDGCGHIAYNPSDGLGSGAYGMDSCDS